MTVDRPSEQTPTGDDPSERAAQPGGIIRLKMSSVRKAFGATQALKDVSLEVGAGEVHALIGENGAGKSTLMKILSGAHARDDGTIELDGKPFSPEGPLHARSAGIAMIYQELNLAPDLSVAENILLGEEPGRFGWIDLKKRKGMARAALEELRHGDIPLDAPVNALTIAEQQLVEIARALVGQPKVLIMDEPTSSLTQVDSERLFGAIEWLRDKGVSVIYISHFLEECQRVCDRFTVLRDGETVGQGDINTADLNDIIRMMVGREVSEIYPKVSHKMGEPILELQGVAGPIKPRSASFVLRKGEVLGIAGLVGAGRTEMVRACFGLDQMPEGSVLIAGRENTDGTPTGMLRQGVGLLSENRKEEGLMLNRTIAENLTITNLAPFSRAGLISGRAQREAADGWMKKLNVRARDSEQGIDELSGGNQQKVAIARLLHHDATVFLLDEPTRGIDVGSKAEIYRLISELAGKGKAVLFISSYLPELLGVCDSIAVMCRGVLSEKRPVSEWDEHSIISVAIGRGDESGNDEPAENKE